MWWYKNILPEIKSHSLIIFYKKCRKISLDTIKRCASHAGQPYAQGKYPRYLLSEAILEPFWMWW
jgi:hypothetical protein